jgi:hypothetical protein
MSAVRNIPGLPIPKEGTPGAKQTEKVLAEFRANNPVTPATTYTEPKMGFMGRALRKGAKRSSVTARFNRCVKSVRKTVKARPKSSKESAAIAICTKSVLQTRGRTIKKYRKGRLITQKKRKM